MEIEMTTADGAIIDFCRGIDGELQVALYPEHEAYTYHVSLTETERLEFIQALTLMAPEEGA